MEDKRIFGEDLKFDTESGACEENAPKKEKKSSKKDKSAELLAKIEELEGQIAEGNDKYLRMAAEYDNFRRRSREEKSAVYESALSDAVVEFLPIIDNLERAAAIEAEGALKEGVVMIMNSVSGLKLMKTNKFTRRCWVTDFVYPDGRRGLCVGDGTDKCDQCGFCMAGEMASVFAFRPDTIFAGLKLRV